MKQDSLLTGELQIFTSKILRILFEAFRPNRTSNAELSRLSPPKINVDRTRPHKGNSQESSKTRQIKGYLENIELFRSFLNWLWSGTQLKRRRKRGFDGRLFWRHLVTLQGTILKFIRKDKDRPTNSFHLSGLLHCWESKNPAIILLMIIFWSLHRFTVYYLISKSINNLLILVWFEAPLS